MKKFPTKKLVQWQNELLKAYNHGKGKYKKMMLSDYHDIQSIIDMIEDDDPNVLNTMQSLDTMVREDYIPRWVWDWYYKND